MKVATESQGATRGFTMLELMVSIAIVSVVLAVAVPAGARFFQSVQYSGAVKDVIALFTSARIQAVSSGRAQDVVVSPSAREIQLNDKTITLPASVNLVVHSAASINRGDKGVIRFYPEGGSSGGGLDIENPGRGGVKISVDWLIGRVEQAAYDPG